MARLDRQQPRWSGSEAATLLLSAGDPGMKDVYELMEQVAETDITLLIRGESGTGKDLVARALHQLSDRRSAPYVRVNSAALPGELLESELFGFKKGAFTGAHRTKKGRFELANGGTLLLDEIGEIPTGLQAKLLQVLQDGEFTPLGGEESVRVDVRVLAATNRDLERAVEEGTFRQDLYYRLNAISVKLPPLRDRRMAIPILANHFLQKYNAQHSMSARLSSQLMNAIMRHDWPGNVRELENFIMRVVVIGNENMILAEIAPPSTAGQVDSKIQALVDSALAETEEASHIDLLHLKKRAFRVAEKHFIEVALNETQWNRVESADLLGITDKALGQKMRKYQILWPTMASEQQH
jgi:transcriptional regulator with PAS, ATPase and Fis domain